MSKVSRHDAPLKVTNENRKCVSCASTVKKNVKIIDNDITLPRTQHFERAAMRHPADQRLKLFLAEHMVQLFSKRHVFNLGSHVVGLGRHPRKVSIATVVFRGVENALEPIC